MVDRGLDDEASGRGLSYEEALSLLQGLLGREVEVVVDVTLAGRHRPLVAFSGRLRVGETLDLRRHFASRTHDDNYAEGEAVVFIVGEFPSVSFFVVRKDDFQSGMTDDGEVLSYRTGDVRTSVMPAH